MSTEAAGDIGVVTAVKGKLLTIEIQRGGGCKSCSMHALCGQGNTPIVLELESSTPYQIGDKLIMEVGSRERIMSSVIIFMFPLAGLFLGYWIASYFLAELYSVLMGFIGLTVVFGLVRLLDKKMAKQIHFQIGGKCED